MSAFVVNSPEGAVHGRRVRLQAPATISIDGLQRCRPFCFRKPR